MSEALAPTVDVVRTAIVAVRGVNVMLDSDLAALYEVETSALVRAMKRNLDRFPSDFAFQLDRAEWERLRCQSGISNARGGRRTLPYVFTEQGVAMLSGVLRSPRAIAVNVAIMRAFVAMRHELVATAELSQRLDALEQALGTLERSSAEKFAAVFDALRALLDQPRPRRNAIGFTALIDRDPSS
jgi:hypothetical protein